MKLFDFLKEAQEKVDTLQKKAEAITAKGEKAIENHAPKRSLSVEGISKQILAQRDSLRKNGFEKYEFMANRDCCPTCAALNGKHFPITKLKIGVNAPPMHEGCRCSIAAYEDDEEHEAWLDYLEKGGTTSAWEKAKKKKK